MKNSTPIIVTLALLFAGAGFVVEHRFIRPQTARLAAERDALAKLDGEIAGEQSRAAEVARGLAIAEKAAADQAALDNSPARVWMSRVEILQQLLAELPSQRIPEIKLLEPLDWVDVVRRAELDTPENLRATLSAARARARQRFVRFLQEALQRYTEQAGGELPADIGQLARFLSPPADATMLERYSLTRTGSLGAKDENLIVEKSVSDMILSVSLSGWSMTNGPNLLPAPGESELAALQRAAAAMGATVGEAEGQDAERFTRNLRELVEKMSTDFEHAFADVGEEELKQAVKRFMATQPDAKPTNFAELLPYFAQPDKYINALRPLFVQLEYMQDHQGALPSDPAQLRPYVARFNPQEAFRRMKLEIEGNGEHGSLSFSFAPK